MQFLTSIQERWLSRKVLGISISDEHEPVGVVVLNDKGELQISEELIGEERIRQYLKSHPHVCVVVNLDSRFVVHTLTAEAISEESFSEVFEENVPGGKVDEFVIDYSQNLFSFARLAAVEEVLAFVGDFDEQIVGVYLSPTSGVILANYLKAQDERHEVAVDQYQYIFDNDQVLAVEPAAPSAVQAGEQRIEAHLVLPFVSVVTFTSRTQHAVTHSSLAGKYEELFYKMLFNRMKMPVLGGVLLIFLLNTGLFFVLDKENKELKEQSSYIQQLDTKLGSLNKFIAENSDVVTAAGVQYSMICDQLASKVPTGISLSRLVINPPVERSRNAAFEQGKMIIEGEASNARVFSAWLSGLHQFDWVVAVEKQSYESISAGEERSRFQLILNCDVAKFKL